MKKRYIFVITIVALLSISAVSAGGFDFLGGSGTVTIDKIDFNIPSGYEELEEDNSNNDFYNDEISDEYEKFNVETKNFQKTKPDPEHPGMASIILGEMHISIISDSKDLSLDDVKNNSAYDNKTINGKSGLYKEGEYSNTFYYVENGKLIRIDGYQNDGDLNFEDVIVESES